MQNVKKLFPQAFMTMAAEIKNRVGPPAAAQPGAAGHCADRSCCYHRRVNLALAGVKIDSKPVEANKAGGCC